MANNSFSVRIHFPDLAGEGDPHQLNPTSYSTIWNSANSVPLSFVALEAHPLPILFEHAQLPVLQPDPRQLGKSGDKSK
jgi:hypothetical protein